MFDPNTLNLQKYQSLAEVEKYKKEEYEEVMRFLERFFYDGPLCVNNMMWTVMRESKGQINPKVADEIIHDFINKKENEQ